ncbi:MAG: tetratricopeptide repeat protein [Coriobacteriia bacterium]|nr:tetratricopeptide repeat protein [Coriobacteriia bacterium]
MSPIRFRSILAQGLAAVALLVSLTGCSADGTQIGEHDISALAARDTETTKADAEAMVRNPELRAQGHAILGKVSEASGDLAQARQSYERSLDVDPRQPTVLHDLAVLKHAEGEVDEAIRMLRDALAIDPSLHGSRLLLADILSEAGRAREASREYQALIDAAPQGIDLDMVRTRMEVGR